MFERNVDSLQALKNTTIGRLINRKVKQHNKTAKKTLKAYSIWAAVVYLQKDTGRIGHTQREMRISSYKSKHELTRAFIEIMLKNGWKIIGLDVEFIGLDDEHFDPSYTITLLKDIDVLDLPLYRLKDEVTNGVQLYNKFLPLFDGLVKDADEDLFNEFENKCGEFSIYYTLAKAVTNGEIVNNTLNQRFYKVSSKVNTH